MVIHLDVGLQPSRTLDSIEYRRILVSSPNLCRVSVFSSMLSCHHPQVIELGEDLLGLALRDADEASLFTIAATCRCLRGLLLPRLLEQKSRAVREIFLSM